MREIAPSAAGGISAAIASMCLYWRVTLPPLALIAVTSLVYGLGVLIRTFSIF
jgi:hypothetical protein